MNKIVRLAAIVCVLLPTSALVGCGRGGAQQTPPHLVASLSDHHYFWFLYRGDDPSDLHIWRVNTSAPDYERFKAPVKTEDTFRRWQLDGGWIWYLTDTGLWRVGRFPPDTGDIEHFERKLINVEAIGEHSTMLVENARIIIGGEMGLFLFDRQGPELIKITGQRVTKLRSTPFGVVVFAEREFYLLDTTVPEPALKRLTLKAGHDWREVPPGAYTTADPERSAVVAMIDRSTMLFFDLEKMNVELEPREFLSEAYHYGDRLWLLTSRPRLLSMVPGTDDISEYNLYHIEGITPDFMLQDGRLRCGPIVIEKRGEDIIVGAVRFWPGDIKPLPPARGGALADVKLGDEEAAIDDTPETEDKPESEGGPESKDAPENEDQSQ